MSNALKGIIVGLAIVVGLAWVVAVFTFAPWLKPYVKPYLIAYPLFVLGALWIVGFLGAVAFVCTVDKEGVSAGEMLTCALPGSVFALMAMGFALVCGPMIGGFALGTKWFPNKEPPTPKPADHWSRLVVFRCPGKPGSAPRYKTASDMEV